MKLRIIDVTPIGERLIASYLLMEGSEALLIDTGPRSTVDRVLEALWEEGVKPSYIILTHIHLDHAGAAADIARETGATILVHPRGAKHVVNPDRLWEASRAVLGPVADLYGRPNPAPEHLVREAGDGEVLEAGGLRLRIIHTPGHASHHMSIHVEGRGLMFLGDSAGIVIDYMGERVALPSTPPPFKPQAYIESVERMIRLAPSEAAPGHYGTLTDATSYLRGHLDQIKRWMGLVEQALGEGVSDVARVAEYVADRDGTASKLYSSNNPVISQMFYMGTIWGLVEALRGRS